MDDYVRRCTRNAKKVKGLRFAREAKDLFPPNSPRSGDPSYYTIIGSGWFADTNLNHDDKFATLLQLASIAQLTYPVDWEFRVSGATAQLQEHQRVVKRAQELLQEFLTT